MESPTLKSKEVLREIMKIGVLVTQLIFFLCLIFTGNATAQADGSVDYSFSLEHPSVTLNEPIMITFTILNVGTEVINLNLGKDFKANFNFTIIHPDGLKIRVPEYPLGGTGQSGNILVSPTSTHIHQLLLNERYQISQPGKYIIEAELNPGKMSAFSEGITPRVFGAMHLEVQKRNHDKLKTIIEALSETALGLNPADGREAAWILSNIQDPIAIPYLVKIVDRGFWKEQEAIAALGSIGSRNAIKYLEAVAEDETRKEGIRRSARRALRKAKPK